MSGSPDGASREILDRLWDEVAGQDGLVQALRSAAEDPVQAYLLVGPEGSGKRAAAAAFAAELLGVGLVGAEAERSARLAAAGNHPSMHLIERVGPSISAEAARDLVKEASRAPLEGSRQVFVLDEFHLVADAAPILLKAIEEPEPATVFVVLAEEITDPLVTIASRCVTFELSPVPVAVIESRLVASGIAPNVAAEAAAASGGSLRRANLLATDPELVARRALWRDAPGRLDGSGSSACIVADELLGSIESVLDPVTAKHEGEVVQFEEQVERTGSPLKGQRKAMEDRHRREVKRIRTAELSSGLAAIVTSYREAASSGGDEAARRFVSAAAEVQKCMEAMTFNPNEALALRALLLRLPL